MLNAVRTAFYCPSRRQANNNYAPLSVHDVTGEFGEQSALPRIGGKSKCRRCCGFLPAMFARHKPFATGGGHGGAAAAAPNVPSPLPAQESDDRPGPSAIPIPSPRTWTEGDAQAAAQLAEAYNRSPVLATSPSSSDLWWASRPQPSSIGRGSGFPGLVQVSKGIVAATPRQVSNDVKQLGRSGDLQLHLPSLSSTRH
ncbi:hypothetical protein [Paracidovorax citrulli]